MKTPTPEAVKALRTRYKLTQAEFGKLIHASRVAVTLWETGTNTVAPAWWELLNLKVKELDHPGQTFATPTPAEIKALRATTNLSQTEFGWLVHTSLRGVAGWELGERKMHPAFWELANRKVAAIKAGALFGDLIERAKA